MTAAHGEVHYDNSDMHDWVKKHFTLEQVKGLYEVKRWLCSEKTTSEPSKISWKTFCHVVADLVDRNPKTDKFEVFQVDGTNRRLKKLLEWTMELDEDLHKLDNSLDMTAWMEANKEEYPIIKAFALDEMIVALN